jgi:hypothetical protein
VLLSEPGNEHDTNAIAVHADGIGLLGYLSRDTGAAISLNHRLS